MKKQKNEKNLDMQITYYAKLQAKKRRNNLLSNQLKEPQETKHFKGLKNIQISYGALFVKGSYEIIKKDNKDFIVNFYKPGANRFYYANRFPDLFIRFAELQENKEAYLSFISEYGLIGLNQSMYVAHIDEQDERNFANTFTWQKNEESILLINKFYRGFKQALNWINDYLKKRSNPDDERCLHEWLTWQIRTSGITLTVDLSGNITFTSTSLISALILQLYQYLIVGKITKICPFPDCGKEHTRKKFCSLEHQKLFNQLEKRGNLIEVDGKIQVVKKKRGRPKVKND